jgi:hypothetical protein
MGLQTFKIISKKNGQNRPLLIWVKLIICWDKIQDLEVVAPRIDSALQVTILLEFFKTRRDHLDMRRVTKEIILSNKKWEALMVVLSWLEEIPCNSQKESVLTRIPKALSPSKDPKAV